MAKSLPARPHLDHLRRQAKEMLASFQSGETKAAETFLNHLPSAKNLSLKQIQALPLRLADAQSAVARSTGFASWPSLAHHVDQLRAMEGTWKFDLLEIDGQSIPSTPPHPNFFL